MPIQSEALIWHSVWINSGRPQSGFVYDMRRSTRKAYHEKVASVLKREKQIKGIRIADSYQARVQEFARGGAQNLKGFFFFFFCFLIFQGGPSSECS